MLQLTKPLAFIDLETTGINLGSDRIVEIAIVKILPDGNKSVKRKLINPEMPIPKTASDIHGITDEMVKSAPVFKQAAHELKQFLDSCDLAGYNSNRFDIPLMVEEFLRAGVDFDMKGRKLIDVQKIFHQMEQRTLSAAYKFYCDKNWRAPTVQKQMHPLQPKYYMPNWTAILLWVLQLILFLKLLAKSRSLTLPVASFLITE